MSKTLVVPAATSVWVRGQGRRLTAIPCSWLGPPSFSSAPQVERACGVLYCLNTNLPLGGLTTHMLARSSFPMGLPSEPLPAVEGPKSWSSYQTIVPSQLHASGLSSTEPSRNLRHAHPDFPAALNGTTWTPSPRDILVDTSIPLFSAPMIGACWLGLFLTFSGVPVGSATVHASALAVLVKRTRSKAAAGTRAMFRSVILRTVLRFPSAR